MESKISLLRIRFVKKNCPATWWKGNRSFQRNNSKMAT